MGSDHLEAVGCPRNVSLAMLFKFQWMLLLVPITALDASPDLSCFEHAHHGRIARGLMLVYTVLSTILLINMLIARMAKSFDLIWAEQALNYRHGFARVVFFAMDQSLHEQARRP